MTSASNLNDVAERSEAKIRATNTINQTQAPVPMTLRSAIMEHWPEYFMEGALGVFFGTGVGGAAIIDKKLHTGASGVGGQVGAVLAQPMGGSGAAFSHGIVDRIASKTAIASEAWKEKH